MNCSTKQVVRSQNLMHSAPFACYVNGCVVHFPSSNKGLWEVKACQQLLLHPQLLQPPQQLLMLPHPATAVGTITNNSTINTVTAAAAVGTMEATPAAADRHNSTSNCCCRNDNNSGRSMLEDLADVMMLIAALAAHDMRCVAQPQQQYPLMQSQQHNKGSSLQQLPQTSTRMKATTNSMIFLGLHMWKPSTMTLAPAAAIAVTTAVAIAHAVN